MMPGPARSRPGTGSDATDDARISATMTTKDPTTTALNLPLVKFFKHSGPLPNPTRTDNHDNSDTRAWWFWLSSISVGPLVCGPEPPLASSE